jgi:hypothetical protein
MSGSETYVDTHSRPVSSYLTGRRVDPQELLCPQLARMRVDGGAPYLIYTGRPQYPPDDYDTPDTYPLAGYRWAAEIHERNDPYAVWPKRVVQVTVMRWIDEQLAPT